MSAVHITGCSGAGKTAIAAELARRGLTAIDADGAILSHALTGRSRTSA